MADLDIAAVVVNFDSGHHLKNLVEDLLAADIAQIVIVDNGSTDSSLDFLKAAASDSTNAKGRDPVVIQLEANLGYGAAANVGVGSVKASNVVIMNPDLRVARAALEAFYSRVQIAGTGVVGPKVINVDGSTYASGRRFPSLVDGLGHAALGRIAPQNRFTRRYKLADADPDAQRPADWVSGCCFAMNKAVFDRLGGFDDRYFLYFEDVDLCKKSIEAGYSNIFLGAGCTVEHAGGASTSKHKIFALYHHHKSALLYELKWGRGLRRVAVVGVAPILTLRFLLEAAMVGLSRISGLWGR